MEKLKTVVSYNEHGGFGDIVAGRAIQEKLKENKISSTPIFYDASTKTKFENLYGKKRFRMPSSPLICISPIKKRLIDGMESQVKYLLNVTEYDFLLSTSDKRDLGSTSDKRNLGFMSGIGYEKFSKDQRVVSPGIYQRKSIENLLQNPLENKEILKLIKNESQIEFPKKLKDPFLDADISIAYTSKLSKGEKYFKILAKAKDKLEKPLFVFTFSSNDYLKQEIEKISFQEGFNYYNLNNFLINKKLKQRNFSKNSNVFIVDIGSIKENLFQTILTNTTKTSLITGDHSLSQMIQKGLSDSPVPYFYLKAVWKNSLLKNMVALVGRTNPRIGNLFASYAALEDNNLINEFKIPQEKFHSILPELFYNQDLIDEFNEFSHVLKNNFIEIRKNSGIKEAETLWDTGETVAKITKKLIENQEPEEAIKDFIPSK